MYWLYLVIFVMMVFVPDMVRGEFFGFNEDTAEELVIFFLGSLGFICYLIKEKQFSKNEKDKVKAQREASRMSKDLTSSYSFIGEINRKLEIFKNISLGLPLWWKMTLGRKKEVFEYIMAAIKTLTKAEEFCLVFVEKKSFKELMVLKSKKSMRTNIIEKYCSGEDRKYFETDQFIITVSPEDIHGVISIIMIKKKNTGHTFDDPDILKAIASQALFLYVFTERRRNGR